VRESLAHVLLQACECCLQTGQVKTQQTVGYEILREIETQARQFDCQGFRIKLSTAMSDWFYQKEFDELRTSLEKALQKQIELSSQAAFKVDQYEVLPF
jgi:ribonuclease G